MVSGKEVRMYSIQNDRCRPTTACLSETVASGQSSWLERSIQGDWTVHGSSADDEIRVLQSRLNGSDYLNVFVNRDSYLIPVSGPNAAHSVGIEAGEGNDSVFVDPGVTYPLFINGGPGNDYLKGGSGPNALLGGGGNDILIGNGSDDLFLGGSGDNTIAGNGGRDMYSVTDLFNRLREGRCCASSESSAPPAPPPPSQPPVVASPPPAPVVPTPHPPVQPQVPPPPSVPWLRPQGPARPPLASVLSNVDTHNEKGFKSGKQQSKQLLTALYTSPNAFQSALASLQSDHEKDDAAASFVRALLESGPGGARLLKRLSPDQKKTLADDIGNGNCWSPNKKGLLLLLSRMTGVWDRGFGNDQSAIEFANRYQGVMS